MSGYAGSVVECTFREEEPDAVIIVVGVAAIANMSVGCAGHCQYGSTDSSRASIPSSIVCVVRYCFDWQAC